MNMKKLLLLLFLMPNLAMAEASVYDLVLKGKTCSEGRHQQLDCNYTISDDFNFSIAGVGQEDAGVAFMKSNFNGKYYATFGMLHGCVIVKASPKNKAKMFLGFAFVSPINGKIYSDWESCKLNK